MGLSECGGGRGGFREGEVMSTRCLDPICADVSCGGVDFIDFALKSFAPSEAFRLCFTVAATTVLQVVWLTAVCVCVWLWLCLQV